jgi:CRISPR-associated endonuclease/helicase Cas3
MEKHLIAHLRESDSKPQSLLDHLLGVSDLSEKFAEKIGLGETGKLMGLLHDIGKASNEFQQYIKSATGIINPDEDEYIDPISKKGRIDHSSAGAQFIYKQLSEKNKEGLVVGQIISLCLASHHSGLIDCISPSGENKFLARLNKDENLTHLREVMNYLPHELRESIDQIISQNKIIDQLITKLKEIREPVDSRDTYMFKCGLLIRFLFSALIDADRIDTSNFEIPLKTTLRNQGKYVSWNQLLKKFNKVVEKYKEKENKNNIDILRNSISESCYEFSQKQKGVFYLTVPTGGGKTISSLRFALNHAEKHNLDRVIYIIPYTSIIDQNADEIRKILEEENINNGNSQEIVFEHHSNLTPEKETYRHKLLAENWDAPIVFTTQVQFLETLFGAGTKSARRMHQLANSVLIFDEIQTLPIRCVHMFNVAIRFLVNQCGSSVVLCTATQPLLHAIDPISKSLPIQSENKIISNENKLYEAFKRVEVKNRIKIDGWNDDSISELVLEEITKTNSVLIIVNTKKSAINLYTKLKEKNCPGLYHLSTNMCPAHRISTLKKIKHLLTENKNNAPVVCVSTQLIEAGVDVDFGTVIRYLAGLDSLTQAAGRCNRNNHNKIGYVHLINPENEKIKYLNDIATGIRVTERVLDEFSNTPNEFDNDPIGVKILERYYQYYFHDRKHEMGYKVSPNSIIGRNDELFNLLSENTISISENKRIDNSGNSIMFPQSFQSANKVFRVIDTISQGVIVPYKKGKEIILDLISDNSLQKQYQLLREAQKFSINLFFHEFKKLIEINAISEIKEGEGIYYLNDAFYSEETGFQPNDSSFIDNLIF